MKSISGRDFARLLERKGWTLRRIKGSHHIYTREGSKLRISVPVYGNRTLKIGLLKRLMKDAGLDNSDL